DLVSPSTRRAHQCFGVAGNSPGSTGFSPSSDQQGGSGAGRQYHSFSLPEEGRRHALQPPSQPDFGDFPVLRNPSCDIASASYSRPSKRTGRCSVSAGSSPVDGVDFGSGLLRTSLQPLGAPNHRPVCNTREQASSPILFA